MVETDLIFMIRPSLAPGEQSMLASESKSELRLRRAAKTSALVASPRRPSETRTFRPRGRVIHETTFVRFCFCLLIKINFPKALLQPLTVVNRRRAAALTTPFRSY